MIPVECCTQTSATLIHQPPAGSIKCNDNGVEPITDSSDYWNRLSSGQCSSRFPPSNTSLMQLNESGVVVSGESSDCCHPFMIPVTLKESGSIKRVKETEVFKPKRQKEIADESPISLNSRAFSKQRKFRPLMHSPQMPHKITITPRKMGIRKCLFLGGDFFRD